MSYCRFVNTYNDLQDCFNKLDEINEHVYDDTEIVELTEHTCNVSESELFYMKKLAKLCYKFARLHDDMQMEIYERMYERMEDAENA